MTIPTIDIGPFSGTDADRRAVAAAIDEACREVGFLQVVDHGVPAPLIAEMLDVVDRFFALPSAVKQQYLPVSPDVNNGYSPVGSESLAYSLGVDAPPDLFEAFNYGPEDMDLSDPVIAAEAHRIFAPNLWPTELPDMSDVALRYFAEVRALAHRMTAIFAVALDLPPDFFEPFTDHSTDTLRLNHYLRSPGMGDPLPDQQRMGAHTDYGIVTCLYGDPVPGLEVLGLDDRWHPIVPVEGGYVINIGDLLAQWTNDRWRSTLHRVVPPPRGDDQPNRRRSMAFFHDGNYDAVVECLPTCCDDANPARYPPVRALDHLLNKLLGGRTMTASDSTGHAADRVDSIRT